MISDKIIYCLNSAAVGDLMASAPVLKWVIEAFHKNQEYKVAIFDDFKDLFPFVPQDKFIPIAPSYDGSFAVRQLNMSGVGGNIARLTPSRVNLTQYASIGLASRVLPTQMMQYIPLEEVDVSHFGIDFSKCAIFLTTYRDITRAWKGEEIQKVADYVMSKGITPVFVGKRGAISIWKTLAKTDFEFNGTGIDLIDKTTFRELFTIMNKSKVIFGIDSGPLHIAFATKTPVVAGFTNVHPMYRVPFRDGALTESVFPVNLDCRFCQSNWNLDFHNFTKCPRNMESPECTDNMKAEYFIEAFERIEGK
jgi:hypothetical protein